MVKRIVLLASVLATLSGVMAVIVEPAQAATGCHRVKAKPDGFKRCYKVTRIKHHRVWAEAMPAVNHSKDKVRAHVRCGFAQTIERRFELGGSYTGKAGLSLLKLVEASGSWTLALKLHQTASQAREIAGDFRLKPGQKVMCVRTYGYVTARVKSWDRWDVGGQIRNVRTRKLTAPSSLGILFR